MVVTLALLTLFANGPDSPWEAPEAPELYPPQSVINGIARHPDGSVTLTAEADRWLGGFVKAMRSYPAEAQKILDQARDHAEQRRQKDVAEAEAKAEAAIAVQSQDVMTLGDKILMIGGAALGGLAVGLLVGLFAGN